jgi:hypothetical protein
VVLFRKIAANFFSARGKGITGTVRQLIQTNVVSGLSAGVGGEIY